jgi:hypothetical protein
MASLGEFGAELAVVDDELEPDTFLFHGHEFALPAKVSSLPALRFAYNTQTVIAAEERAQAAAQRARTPEQRQDAARLMAEVQLTANAGLYAYLRAMLPGGEWERFETVAAEHGADEEELLDVAKKIMAAVASRPTRRSSGSPAGPSPTGPTSTDDSDSPPLFFGPDTDTASANRPTGGTRTVVLVPEPAEEMTPLEAARAEIRESSASVADLVRSGI